MVADRDRYRSTRPADRAPTAVGDGRPVRRMPSTTGTTQHRYAPTRRSDAWTAPRRAGFPNHCEVIEASPMVQTPHTATVHSRQSSDPPQMGIDTTTSWDLVTAAQQGDREAFGRLYGRYAGPVARFVTSRVADRALAEDLTSETFLRALRRIDSVHDQGRDIGAWFTTIARNLVADHAKSSRHRREQTTADVPEPATAAAAVGPEQTVIQRDTAEQLRRCVAQLSPDQQECIRLRFGQDLSSAQTAAAMGRSELAVRGLRHRALAHLREAMTAQPTAMPAAREPHTDPMARARRAVAHVRAHRAGTDRRVPSQARAEQVARWHTADQADAQERSARADGLGVA